MAGASALSAPINWAGTVLSQLPRSTTPSIGAELIISSTSIDTRLRSDIDVGRTKGSLIEMVGNSRGKPPAAITPHLTASATSRNPPLQGFSSLQLLAIPMTGRSTRASE